MMKRYILLISIFTSLAFAACNIGSSFDEYEGESFLTSSSLSSEGWQLMPDYSSGFSSEGTAATDYMDYSSTGETGPLGGPVYRLEIKNLLQNGDFEENSKTPWVYFENTGDATIDPPNDTEMDIVKLGDGHDSYLIDNYTAYIQTENKEYLRFELKSGLINSNTYIPNKNFLFHFDYRTPAPFSGYFVPDWTNNPTLSDENFYQANGGIDGVTDLPSFNNLNTYPPTSPIETQINDNRFTASSTAISSNTDSLTLVGYAEGSQGGYFDNFRVIRESEGDFDLRLMLKLLSDHRSDLDLIDGYYKFTVYVKQESSPANNTFLADRVELGIHGYDTENQKTVEEHKVFYKTQALATVYATTTGTFAGDWTSNWVELEFASNTLIQLSQLSSDAVMELTISPSNPGNTDSSWNRLAPGSILIADPRLEYSETPWN